MEKKVDLRIQKTTKAIREAFIQIRKKMPLEKVKVLDICRLAMINSSTFYDHYVDVFALSDQLENEILSKCFNDFKLKGSLFSESERFILTIPQNLEAQNDLISTLFKDRQEVLYMKLEKQLLDYYRYAGIPMSKDILLSFIIGGTMRTMQTLNSDKRYTEEQIAQEIAGFISKLNTEDTVNG